MRSEIDKTIEEMRSWIDENTQYYEQAKQKLSDPEFMKTTLVSIHTWVRDLLSYNPVKHPEHVPSFLVGRFQGLAASSGLFADIEFIRQYEEEVERFNEAVQEIEGRG